MIQNPNSQTGHPLIQPGVCPSVVQVMCQKAGEAGIIGCEPATQSDPSRLSEWEPYGYVSNGRPPK